MLKRSRSSPLGSTLTTVFDRIEKGFTTRLSQGSWGKLYFSAIKDVRSIKIVSCSIDSGTEAALAVAGSSTCHGPSLPVEMEASYTGGTKSGALVRQVSTDLIDMLFRFSMDPCPSRTVDVI